MIMKTKIGISFLLCLTIIAGFFVIPAFNVNAAATSGTMTFQVTTVTYNGSYAPRNVGAIWIQDSSGVFVKTLKVWARSQISRLTNWNGASARNTVDAVTSATINSHQAHSVSWNCTNTSGTVVNDGTYRVCVEFTETNSTGKYAYFDFTKGTASVNLSPANQSGFTNIKLSFAPAAASPSPSPTATIRPSGTSPSPSPTVKPSASAVPLKTAAIWRPKTELDVARGSLGTATVNGKIYAVGGYMESTGDCLGTVEVYDPYMDSWNTINAEMSTKRFSFGLAAANNKLYAIGGVDNLGNSLATVEEFDPANNYWRARRDMNTPRSNFGVAVVNNLIYVIGGFNDETGEYLDSVERYNPLTDAWETLNAKMPTPRSGFGTAVIGGKIYTIGGYGNSTIPDVVLGNVEAYDTATNMWETKADLLNPKADLGASNINGNIYAFGGVGFNPYSGAIETLKDLEEYDVLNNVWNKKTDMITARQCFGTSEINGKVYVIGGIGSNSLEMPTVEELTVSANSSVPPTPKATPQNSYTVCGYISPDFGLSAKAASYMKSDFKVEISGSKQSAVTHFDGYFQINNVPAGTYTLKISKPGYLSRSISNVSVYSDVIAGSSSAPIDMWVGDIPINGTQDGVINMSDIMQIAGSFNSIPLDGRYLEYADMNKDSAVNMGDIMIIIRHFNKTSTDYPDVSFGPVILPSPAATTRTSLFPTPTRPGVSSSTGPSITPEPTLPSTLPSTVPGGNLSFQVTTTSYNGSYAPRHVLAIWVQDSSGKFVKSLAVHARSQISRLTNWNSASARNTVDAVTSATLSSHTPHTATWNCTDVNGAIVPNGTYRVCVEFTETNSTGKYAYFDFVKGTSQVHLTPANQTNFTNIKLDFIPSSVILTPLPSGTVSSTPRPSSVTSPVPSSGEEEDDEEDDEVDD